MTAVPDILVIDTCVLLSNVLRRLLLGLAAQGCFQPAWSGVIGDEWRRNASRIWNVPREDIQTQWDALQGDFPRADQGDVSLYKDGLQRSDPKDWHVIAAALAAQAHSEDGQVVAIVTRNIRDFNRTELRQRGLFLFDPDQLLQRCWQQYPQKVFGLCADIPADCAREGHEVESLDSLLRRERLFRFNRLVAAVEKKAGH